MTVHFDQNRRRFICRWQEPTQIVIDKKTGTINRSRVISIKVSETGKLNKRDCNRHEGHPMYPHIDRFNRKLNQMNYFPLKREGHACCCCGTNSDVSPHYDINSKSIMWLCRDHQSRCPTVENN